MSDMFRNNITNKKLMSFIFSGSLLFFAVSGFTALINYIFYPVISRFVSVAEYGEIQFLVSSFNQLAVGFVVLNVIAIVLAYKSKSSAAKDAQINSLNYVAGFFAFTLSVVGCAVLLANSESLQLTSPVAIVALGVSLLLNVPLTITIGHLQGIGRFVAAGMVGLVAAVAKLVFSTVLVALSFGAEGALIGIVIGMLVAIISGKIALAKTKETKEKTSQKFQDHLSRLRHVKNLAIVGLVSIGLITLLSTLDLIISRIILSPQDAGKYAAVATLAKILLAIGSPLMWLALPLAAGKNFMTVFKYCATTALICLCIVAVFGINPRLFISLFMNINAGTYSQLLVLASLSMTLYAVSFISIASLLCIDRLKPVLLTSAITLLIAIIGLASLFITGTVTLHTVLLLQLLLGACLSGISLVFLYRASRTAR